jgi:hypothetical protein
MENGFVAQENCFVGPAGTKQEPEKFNKFRRDAVARSGTSKSALQSLWPRSSRSPRPPSYRSAVMHKPLRLICRKIETDRMLIAVGQLAVVIISLVHRLTAAIRSTGGVPTAEPQ